MFNGWGRSGGGCVQEGPFTVPNFHVNIGEANGSSCLRRDFMPGKTAIYTRTVMRGLSTDDTSSDLAQRRQPGRGPESPRSTRLRQLRQTNGGRAGLVSSRHPRRRPLWYRRHARSSRQRCQQPWW